MLSRPLVTARPGGTLDRKFLLLTEGAEGTGGGFLSSGRNGRTTHVLDATSGNLPVHLWPRSTLLGRLFDLSVTLVRGFSFTLAGSLLHFARHLLELSDNGTGAAADSNKSYRCRTAIGLYVSRDWDLLRTSARKAGCSTLTSLSLDVADFFFFLLPLPQRHLKSQSAGN